MKTPYDCLVALVDSGKPLTCPFCGRKMEVSEATQVIWATAGSSAAVCGSCAPKVQWLRRLVR